MLTLYHSTTSVCSVKVRLVLAEKELNWQGKLLNLQNLDQFDSEYRKLNPSAVVPTLVHDGEVLVESSVIMAYLDETFADPPLQPRGALDRAHMRLWMKLIDEHLHAQVNVLTFATANRVIWLNRSRAEREDYLARTPNPSTRERKRQVMERGIDSPLVRDAARAYDSAFERMEEVLTSRPFLAGDSYSLADAAVTPFLNRLDMLGLGFMWEETRPHLSGWMRRIRSRPNFDRAVSAFVTEADRQRFAAAQDLELAPRVRACLLSC